MGKNKYKYLKSKKLNRSKNLKYNVLTYKNVRMIFARNHIHLCAIEKHLACSSITTITLERGK